LATAEKLHGKWKCVIVIRKEIGGSRKKIKGGGAKGEDGGGEKRWRSRKKAPTGSWLWHEEQAKIVKPTRFKKKAAENAEKRKGPGITRTKMNTA